VIVLVKIAILLIANAVRFVVLSLRSSRSLTAEILFLRRQLAYAKSEASRRGGSIERLWDNQ